MSKKITEGIVSSKVSPNGTHVVISTVSGNTIVVPKADWVSGSETITYMVHSKGDTFTASKDSSRTKGTAMDKDQLAAYCKKYDVTPEVAKDEPLYFKGEVVPRTADSLQLDSFGTFAALSGSMTGQLQALEMQIKQAQLAKELKLLQAA